MNIKLPSWLRSSLLALALLTLVARCASAQYTTPVQHATMTTTPSGPVTLAFGSNVTNGHLVVGVFTWGAASGTFTFSKSSGTATIGTCTSDKAINDATNGQSIGIASCLVTGAGSLTMQGDDAAHSSFSSLEISEWSGNAAASPQDIFGGGTSTSTAPATGAITTTTNGDLVIAGFMNDTGSATITVGSGWTALDSSGSTTANTLFVQYQVQTSAGSINGIAVQSASQGVVAVIGSYKPAGGGGATPCAHGMLGVFSCDEATR